MAQSSTNPLLAKVKLPGRVFQLPSKGLFYEPGVLAESVKDGEVQVKPMSAITEIKLRSPDLLYSNKVINDVCAECAPEILRPDLLVAKDVDALFLFLVISTYGDQKTIKSQHSCEKAAMHSYAVNLEKITLEPNNRILEHRDVIYQVDLPNGQKVHLKPVTFAATLDMSLLKTALARSDVESNVIGSSDIEKLLVQDVLSVIKGVQAEPNGPVITDHVMLVEWLKFLSTHDLERITTAAKSSAEWGFNFTVKLKCKDCSEEYDHDLELNPVNFFTG